MGDVPLLVLAVAIGVALSRALRPIRYPERLWVAGSVIASAAVITIVLSATMPG